MTSPALPTEISESGNLLTGPWRRNRCCVRAMLLNLASIKDSCPHYERERKTFYG